MHPVTSSQFMTDAAAGVAVTSPFWLPPLHVVSDAAALVLPIVGVTWILLQIVLRVYDIRHKRRHIVHHRHPAPHQPTPTDSPTNE